MLQQQQRVRAASEAFGGGRDWRLVFLGALFGPGISVRPGAEFPTSAPRGSWVSRSGLFA
jgi:hypothetical protein